MLNDQRKTQIEEKREQAEKIRKIRNFYIDKGVSDRETLDWLVHRGARMRSGKIEKWWYSAKKRNFFELLEEYKYPLT